MSRSESDLTGLVGYNSFRDAGRGLCTLRVSTRGGMVISRVMGDMSVSTVPNSGV